MKTKEKTQFASMTVADLDSQVTALEKQIAQIQLDRFTKPGKNVRQVREMKTKIAVLKTIRVAKQYANAK
jgi:ribosomal protein L29